MFSCDTHTMTTESLGCTHSGWSLGTPRRVVLHVMAPAPEPGCRLTLAKSRM